MLLSVLWMGCAGDLLRVRVRVCVCMCVCGAALIPEPVCVQPPPGIGELRAAAPPAAAASAGTDPALS